MQPNEYVALIKFAFTISGERKPSIHLEESLSERTREEWVLIPRNGFVVSVRSTTDKFLKKLMKILTEADIAHELTRNNELHIYRKTISKPERDWQR